MYNYQDLRAGIFTDEGQRRFLIFRDRVKRVLRNSGAITMGKALLLASGGDLFKGDTYTLMACIDRMVEIGELEEVMTGYGSGKDRVFVEVSEAS